VADISEAPDSSTSAPPTVRLAPTTVHPAPDDLLYLHALPLVSITATGRSGSLLLHGFLDGHPEVLQVPGILKFADFIAAGNDLRTPGRDFAASFVQFPAHASLFDTSLAIHGQARLGPSQSTAVQVDRDLFVDAVHRLIPDGAHSAREALVATIAGLAWASGQDLRRARVLVQHLHHSDWLAPDLTIDTYNLPAVVPEDITASPDRMLITWRKSATSALRNTRTFSARFCASPDDAREHSETLLRLYGQDELRLDLIRALSVPHLAIALEDMVSDPHGTVQKVAEWLDINPRHPALQEMTLYGLAWWGDDFSRPSNQPHGRTDPVVARISLMDRAYVRCLIGHTRGHVDVPRMPLRLARSLCAINLSTPARRHFVRHLSKLQDEVASGPHSGKWWRGPVSTA